MNKIITGVFMKDKIENAGMVDDFYGKYKKAQGCL
nr:hypothetical protein F987_01975 [Acinetobacter gyllenbergii NIPH 230]